MRNVTKDNLTEAFSAYMGPDVNPRLREVMNSLVTHLHAFAKDVNLTHAEWEKGIEFLERTGDISDPERHEFVLLSDVLGLSSLVDMLHSKPEGTSSSVLGPFHITGSPPLAFGGDLKGDFEGPVLLAQGMIRNVDGEPIEGAVLDIWQTAPNGLYSSQDPEQDGPVGDILSACGRHPWRPSHLHFIVKADGYKPLVTEVFAADDPYLDQDTVFGVREDLVMEYQHMKAGSFPEGYVLSGSVGEKDASLAIVV